MRTSCKHCDCIHVESWRKEFDSESEALRAQLLEWQQAFANQALKLADCQAVIRHKGHDADCRAGWCHKCGMSAHFHGHHGDRHDFDPGPCSDACGHDRATEVKP